MRIFTKFGYTFTIWWWTKTDARQKKPTKGYGIIIERR